jgi:hypothetical protein
MPHYLREHIRMLEVNFPTSYLAPGRIARIDESYSFPFPADFR